MKQRLINVKFKCFYEAAVAKKKKKKKTQHNIFAITNFR